MGRRVARIAAFGLFALCAGSGVRTAPAATLDAPRHAADRRAAEPRRLTDATATARPLAEGMETARDVSRRVTPVAYTQVTVPETTDSAAAHTSAAPTQSKFLARDSMRRELSSSLSGEGENTSWSGDFMRLATWTMVVLGVGIGGILLLKKLGVGGRFASGPGTEIQLRGSLMLAPRTGVHLIGIGAQKFLVAVDPRGVSGLTIVPESFEVDADLLEADHEPTPVAGSRGLRDEFRHV